MTTAQVDPSPTQTTAIIIGAGIAGLTTARAITSHFDSVMLIEQDSPTAELSEANEISAGRRGVPQASHVHNLLLRGQNLLEQYFPGIKDVLANSGAPQIDWTADWLEFNTYGWCPRVPSELVSHTCTRHLLESILREYIQRDSRIKILNATQTQDLLIDPAQGRVVGVRIKDAQGQIKEIHSQLTVDASGRNSKLPHWLNELGYEAPQKTMVNSFLGYGSRWYQKPTHFKADWKGMMIMAQAPDQKRGGVLFPVEGDRWIITLGGTNKDYPPADEAEFLDFARSLRHPLLYETIKSAQPLSPVYTYRATENCWRHYDQLKRWPGQLVVLGDAACTFNPIYGQGMTMGAIAAQLLDQSLTQTSRLDQSQPQFAQQFQQQLAQATKTPWLMATGEDLRWPLTVGGSRDHLSRLLQHYFDWVRIAGNHNGEVHTTFWSVIHMMKKPSAFFQPKVMARVLQTAIAHRRATPITTTDSTTDQLASALPVPPYPASI